MFRQVRRLLNAVLFTAFTSYSEIPILSYHARGAVVKCRAKRAALCAAGRPAAAHRAAFVYAAGGGRGKLCSQNAK